MEFIISISLLLFFSVYPVSSVETPPIQPCTNSGKTRIYITTENVSFPQICTYLNATIFPITSLSPGLYFFNMCYNGGWSNPDHGDDFCYLNDYIGIETRAEYTQLLDNINPKFSGLNCMNGPTDISMCGGTLTTASCGYVTGLTCLRCTTKNDCLGNANSVCNPDGRCSCEACENGVCYVGGCLCSDGYQGDICDERICTPVCQNSGECQENNTCNCSFPYTGNRCEMNITCNPPCSSSSSGCLVDMEAEMVFCCNGEIVGNDCITSTTATPSPPVVVDFSIGTNGIILISVLIVGVLCCIVIGLLCLSITLCVMVTIMMKGKMHKDGKSQQFDLSGYIEERKPTIYSAVNENEMLDYDVPADPPITQETNNYIEIDPVNAPREKKTSHYEIEDDMLEAKISITKIENEASEMFTIREENTVSDEPTFVESPSRVMLFHNDSEWSKNGQTYENQEILQDHQS